MKIWILTGGVAAGKTSASRVLTESMAGKLAFFSADESVSKAYLNAEVQDLLIKQFGCELDVEGGSRMPSRSWLRVNVLPILGRKRELESIIHPFVMCELEASRLDAHDRGLNLFVAEIPLHYETGPTISSDLTIVVAASQSVQVRRMMENRGLDEQSVDAFITAQLPIETKIEKADVVIWNDGDPAALGYQALLLANYSRIQ